MSSASPEFPQEPAASPAPNAHPEPAVTPAPETAGAGPSDGATSGDRPRIQVGKSNLGPRGDGGDRPRGGRPGGRFGGKPGGKPGPRPGGRQGGGPPAGREDSAVAAEAAADAAPAPEPRSARAAVPVPSKRDRVSPELEAELAAALGDLSLDQIVSGDLGGRSTQALETDARLRAQVVRVDKDNIFFSLGGKNEGFVSRLQFPEPPAVGTFLEVIVRGVNEEDGLYQLVVPGASVDVADWGDLAQGAIVEARITGANTGGLECMVNSIRGFIPASQIGLFRVENFGEYVNQKLLCVVTEANETRKNLVLSHRALLEREKEESRRKLLAELEVGQIRDGVVRKVMEFGCFVDLGGVDGMIHVSKLSWDRIKHPSEVVQEGQKVRVRIEKIDEQTGKISLSYRDLLDRPWDDIDQKFPVGTSVRGTVSRLANFGAFVRLAAGVEGLIHISELAHGRVRRVEDVLKEGQEVEVKILSVDQEAQRIGLSFKALLPAPEAKTATPEVEEDETPRALAVRNSGRPLRGGIERSGDGQKFGLNW